MDVALAVTVLGVVAIASVTALAPRVGVAGPLALVGIGVAVSLLPFVPPVEVDPEIILVLVLPPLLYSAAVSLPAMEFRRDFRLISGLSVVLVVLTSLTLGVFFFLVVPGLGLPLGIALGAILSPTDAVATTIVKKVGVSPRAVTVLEGESLLNDATALVLLRSAIAATAGSVALWQVTLDFVWAVVLAVVIGGVVGWVNLRVRAWIANSAANTALSFTVPFLAYLPTEHFGGSGLVAAVVAGVVTGQGAARHFNPEQRLSDTVNWRTVELVLEGAVFLLMGLELSAILVQNEQQHGGFPSAVALAAAAVGIILVLRVLFVTALVVTQRRRARRSGRGRERLTAVGSRIDALEHDTDAAEASRLPARWRDALADGRRLRFARLRVRRALADLDYFEGSPLHWREGAVMVWAGMRGAVTLAAAQTLPRDTPERPVLVLVAFLVAAGTLLLQGGTLAWLVRLLRLPNEGGGPAPGEMTDLTTQLRQAAASALEDPALRAGDGRPFDPELIARVQRRARLRLQQDDAGAADIRRLRLVMIDAERRRLLELRDEGAFSSAALRRALDELDAEQLSLELRSDGD